VVPIIDGLRLYAFEVMHGFRADVGQEKAYEEILNVCR